MEWFVHLQMLHLFYQRDEVFELADITGDSLELAKKVMESDKEFVVFCGVGSNLTIEFPEKADLKAGQTQHYFWNGINYFLKKEARRILPDRVKQLAEKYKFRYSSVKIQPSKTRWGSCSRERSINLSQYLLLLPAHLVVINFRSSVCFSGIYTV